MAGSAGRRAPHTDGARGVALAAGLGVVVVVAAALLLGPGVRGDVDPSPSPSRTTAAATTRSDPPTTVPTPTPTPRAGTSAPAAPAALPPLEQRWRGEGPITSDTPAGDELQDGAFVAHVLSVDASARTITADLVIFHGGDDAFAAARERGGEVDDGIYVVDDVERDRVLRVADDVRVGVWCFDATDLRTVELAFADWAVPTAPGETTACGVRGWQFPGLYWLDVRGGRVAQVTEQYTP